MRPQDPPGRIARAMVSRICALLFFKGSWFNEIAVPPKKYREVKSNPKIMLL
jgi:hypothetical protein